VRAPSVVTVNPEFGWFSVDDVIWLAWQGKPFESDLYEVHHAVGPDARKHGIGWIDVTSGQKHRITNREPLSIEASIGCAQQPCGFHGFIRDGRWVPA
jgi:hypothetical protein